MRITCKRSRLADTAALVGQAVSSKSTKRIFECIRMRALENELEICGTDLEVSVRYRVRDVTVIEPGDAVVPAALFTSLLREIGDETVSLNVARQKLTIETDGGHFELECEDAAQFPEIQPFPASATGRVAGIDLRDLVRKTLFAAGKEASRFVLNGIRLIAEGDGLRFVATDGRRLATLVRPIERVNADDRRTISAIMGVKGAQHFERAAAAVSGTVELAIEDRFIALRAGDAEVNVCVMEGNFPDHEQIIPREIKVKAQLPIQGLIARLRQVEKFASVESQAVALRFRQGELAISAAGTNGRAEVKLGIEYEGEEEKIGFNPAFFLEALRVMEGETAEMGLNNRNAAAKVSDTAGFVYVLMPILIEG